jgi:hypothetical protein
MAEVATGILILVPELRKWAALSSLALLILLLPAVYYILWNADLPTGVAPGLHTPFRVALLPNNIFMAICSVYVWRHPNSSLRGWPPRRSGEVRHRVEIPRHLWNRDGAMHLIVPALLLLANLAGFLALLIGAPGHMGLASLWAMGCIATGFLIGFLFAVPRANPSAVITSRYLPNTNVEAVSDWLTKILVGVGLVNFHAIGVFIDGLAGGLASALETDPPFATGLIVYFFVVGIIEGYILTRVHLAPQLTGERSGEASVEAAGAAQGGA